MQGVASTDLTPHRVHAGEALEQRLPIGPRRLRRQGSPPTSSSQEGRTVQDLTLGPAHAPSSALRIHGKRARQRIAGIGHPLPLCFFIRTTKIEDDCPAPPPSPRTTDRDLRIHEST